MKRWMYETAYRTASQPAVLGITVWLVFSGVAIGQTESFSNVYLVDTGAGDIRTYNPDGSNRRFLTPAFQRHFNPYYVAVDFDGGKMYYTSPPASGSPQESTKIQRANLDGSGREDLVTNEEHGVLAPWGIALDLGAGKMYWADADAGRIQRANLDGSVVEDLVTTDVPLNVALDLSGSKMYWTLASPTGLRIQRANFDGSNVEDLLTTADGLGALTAIELDESAGKMYWADRSSDTINRADMAPGAAVETLVSPQGSSSSEPWGLSLDIPGGKVYWLDRGLRKIFRANLSDGSNVELLVEDQDPPNDPPGLRPLPNARGIFFESNTGKIYWCDANRDRIFRANADIPVGDTPTTRSDIEVLVQIDLLFPRRIALDLFHGKMYWTETGTFDPAFPFAPRPRIQRANLDGSDIEDLITHVDGLITPVGIALDLSAEKIYWTDEGTDSIGRSGLDGSDIDLSFIMGLDDPREIALDVAGGRMYWADRGRVKIQSAALDGTDVRDLLTAGDGLQFPNGVALDLYNRWLYFTDYSSATIRRFDIDAEVLDPTPVVSTGLVGPQGVSLDVADNRMYWTDSQTDKLERADLDGLNREEPVTTGLSSPQGIALDLADEDGDGVAAQLDTAPYTFSNDFSDEGLGGATTGTITDRGDQSLVVIEEPNPAGVRITAVSSGGSNPATITMSGVNCRFEGGGDASFFTMSDAEVIVTCGSLTIEVISGTVEITFVAASGEMATASLGAGNTLSFDPGTFAVTAPNTNADIVVVVIAGDEVALAPGESVTGGPEVIPAVSDWGLLVMLLLLLGGGKVYFGQRIPDGF